MLYGCLRGSRRRSAPPHHEGFGLVNSPSPASALLRPPSPQGARGRKAKTCDGKSNNAPEYSGAATAIVTARKSATPFAPSGRRWPAGPDEGDLAARPTCPLSPPAGEMSPPSVTERGKLQKPPLSCRAFSRWPLLCKDPGATSSPARGEVGGAFN